jgi:hypothetical protein
MTASVPFVTSTAFWPHYSGDRVMLDAEGWIRGTGGMAQFSLSARLHIGTSASFEVALQFLNLTMLLSS